MVVFKPPLPSPGLLDSEGGLKGEGDEVGWAGVSPYGRIAVVGAGLTGVSSAA